MLPAFFGLAGPELTADERALFRAADPAGYILFARNCIDPAQLSALTASLRDLAARDVPILIDQEGGRVARLRPPHWPAFPPAAAFAALYEVAPLSALEAARLNGLALAALLRAHGINVDCVPVLDVPAPDGHDIIGDRAYGTEPSRIAALGGATLDGLQASGVIGVVKHLPGHGRARADSHLELPLVDAPLSALETDFAPFAQLSARALMGMTAHVTYAALDPDRCASLSRTIIADIIRGRIGFTGLLMSDDLGMHALEGPMGRRATAVIEAGCDIALHCSGDFAEMAEVAEALGGVTEQARARLDAAMAVTAASPLPLADLIARRDALLAFA